MTSVNSCRMREVEVVGSVELVYVGGLLRMGGDSLLVPVKICWRRVHWQRGVRCVGS